MKQLTSPGLRHETGRSGLVYWDDPEGWDGEGGGRGVQDGGHIYTKIKKKKRMSVNLDHKTRHL